MASIRRPARRSLALVISTICALVALFGLTANAGAVTRSGGTGTDPWIASELPDYAPGSVVSLLGGSWQPGEAVHITINDNEGQTWVRGVDVTADSNGDIGDSFALPDWFVATYAVTATGATSGTATATFTDGDIRVRAGRSPASANTAVTVAAGKLKLFSSSDCSGSSTSSNANAFTTGGGGGNGYASPSPALNAPTGTSFSVEVPASTTVGTTTYSFSSWQSDGTNATLLSTSGTTGCFLSNANGQISLTANYTDTVATTTTAANASATYGNANVSLSATVSPSSTNVGTVTFTVKSGATTIGTVTSGTVSGGSASGIFPLSGVAAGTYTIAATYSGGTGFGASTNSAQSPAPTLTVGKKGLTIIGAVANGRIYDGTTAATVAWSGASLSGIVGSDSVALDTSGYSASFANKNVGSGKPVTVAGVGLSGSAASNYTVAQPSGLTASISAKEVSVSFAAQNKAYDGTTAATIKSTPAAALVGVVSGDTVTLDGTSATASFANRNVGSGKTVTPSGFTKTGADAGNYVFAGPQGTTTADITARDLTVTAHGLNKIYDGTTSATVTLTTDKLAGDTVSAAYTSASFSNRHVGTGKTVTVNGISISGADASNYNLTNTAAATGADITSRPITIAAVTDSKVYDGTTGSDETPVLAVGAYASGDTPAFAQAYAGKSVGTGKTLVPSGSVSDGNGGDDYAVTFVNNTTGEITAKELSVSFEADSKTYDGTTAATIKTSPAPSLVGTIGGDDVTLDSSGASADFDSKTAGTAKTVTGSGFTKSGADAGNYVFAAPQGTTTADIAAKGLTIDGAAADDKTYDGNDSATVDFDGASLAGEVSGDDVSIDHTGYSASFADKNVGADKPVTVTGVMLSGGDAGNYGVSQPSGLTADIAAKGLTITGATADGKTYDGTDATTVDWSGASLAGVVSGDDVAIDHSSYTARFADKHVGSGKPVTVAGTALSGDDAGNYTVGQLTGLKADVAPARLDISAVADSKTYDGTTDSSGTPTLGGSQVKGSDSVDGLNQDFESKDVLGAGNSTLVVTGYAIHDGNAGGNYDVHTHTAAGTISAKALSVTGAAASNKTYDGGASATVDFSGASLAGVVSGDDVAIDHTGYAASFANKNVGAHKPVTVNGVALSADDSGNYAVGQPSGLEADITPLAIGGSFDSANKVYDGTVAAAATNRQLSGVLGSDDVNLSGGTASFDTKNVGTGKPVSLSGAALVGADRDNYSLSSVADAHADITRRDLIVTAHGIDRTYDGTTDATVTLSSDKLAVDSVSAAYASAAFASKHAGPGRSVSVAGISISGSDAGNYHLLNTSAATGAEIFKRPISVSAAADTKVYDGTTGSDETPTVSSGTIASGDTAAFSQAFATKTVGSGKTLIPSGSVLDGNGGGDYAVSFVNATNGVITAKNLTVSGITASDKPFDGNTAATLNVSGAALVGLVSGDAVTLGTGAASGAFTSSAPGTCTVQVSGLSIAGAESANYTLTQPVVVACIAAWHAAGFYAPVGIGNSQFVTSPGAPPTVSPVSTTWNIAKGGSTIPLKFNLYNSPGGAERTNVADIRSFDAVKLSCTTGEGEAAVDFITTGNTSLRYDGSQFIQNWKTPSSSTDTCYRASVKFQDGSAIYAFFKLRK